ncbi:MAG: hypothetical protein WC285_05260 [Candidatus Gracilibacteria bacterium]|jgi:hypothetical protein
MKKIAIAIITMSLLLGCNESFLAEKESCFKHLATLEKEFNDGYSIEGESAYTQVSEIFYSPKVDSCLYILETRSNSMNAPGSNGIIVNYDLYNLLTKERLIDVKGCDGELHCGLSTTEAETTFKSKIVDYK